MSILVYTSTIRLKDKVKAKKKIVSRVLWFSDIINLLVKN